MGPALLRVKSGALGGILFILGICVFAGRQVGDEDWVLYGTSREETDASGTTKDWYRLNRVRPIFQSEAAVHHFYDRNSLASSSPYSGGISRVWEKTVMQRTTNNYFETKQDIEKQEENRLKRKLTTLDQAWIFPLAVKGATKETHTLFEINCDSKEFVILEVNHYDKDGNRMSREQNMDRRTWHPIVTGTLMDALFQKICHGEAMEETTIPGSGN